ncbi:MAG: hypothetical protein HQK89_03265 [Nitrospirae bacterium]|nr:hypothetical protein [Nitrospirota bacterium]
MDDKDSNSDKEHRYGQKGMASPGGLGSAVPGRHVVALPAEDEALAGELTVLTKKHTALCRELDELTQRINKSDKSITDSAGMLKLLNKEIAVHTKDVRAIQNEILLLKKSLRPATGLADAIEGQFERQSAVLEEYREKERAYCKELSEIDALTRLLLHILPVEQNSDIEQNADKMLLELEARNIQESKAINELTERKHALDREVSGLEGISASFVQRRRLQEELSLLSSSLLKNRDYYDAIKVYINDTELLLPQLIKKADELERHYKELEEGSKDIESLLSERSSLLKENEEIHNENSFYASEITAITKDLENKTARLRELVQSNVPSKKGEPGLKEEIKVCQSKISDVKESLARNKEIGVKKDYAVAGLIDAFKIKSELENELTTLDGQMSKLIHFVRSSI